MSLHGPYRVLGLSGTCFPQNCPFPFGDPHPHVMHCSSGQAHDHPKRQLDRFSRFCMGLKWFVYSALSVGKKTPKTAPSPWDFVTLPEEDRATAIGNMHMWFRWYPRRQTHRHTQTYLLQYFAIIKRGLFIRTGNITLQCSISDSNYSGN